MDGQQGMVAWQGAILGQELDLLCTRFVLHFPGRLVVELVA